MLQSMILQNAPINDLQRSREKMLAASFSSATRASQAAPAPQLGQLSHSYHSVWVTNVVLAGKAETAEAFLSPSLDKPRIGRNGLFNAICHYSQHFMTH